MRDTLRVRFMRWWLERRARKRFERRVFGPHVGAGINWAERELLRELKEIGQRYGGKWA